MPKMTIRDVQEAELSVFKKVLRLMEDNNITYFALGGTLLGAIRHKGFIPWDDDIDIGIPRPDYDRFIKIAEEAFKYPLEVVTTQNNPNKYTYYYIRVVDNSIDIVRNSGEKSTIIHPWIDVFPLDGTPSQKKDFNQWYRRVLFWDKVYKFAQFDYFFRISSPHSVQSDKHRFIKTTIKWIVSRTKIYRLISKQWAWNCLNCELSKYDYSSSKYLFNALGFWKIKELFPKHIYGKGKKYSFEDISICGPENYDFVLKQMYGDYMTPPPDKEKNHHNTELV